MLVLSLYTVMGFVVNVMSYGCGMAFQCSNTMNGKSTTATSDMTSNIKSDVQPQQTNTLKDILFSQDGKACQRSFAT